MGSGTKRKSNDQVRINTPAQQSGNTGGIATGIDTSALSAPIFQDKQVVLFAGGIDALIEHLWFKRHHLRLFDKIAAMNFYAVTGLNFSLFLGECPFGQALNINKSLVFCQELDRRGVCTLPNIYATNDAQRKRWASFLAQRPAIQQVAMNSQLQRTKASIAVDDANIRYLLERTVVNILIQGRRVALPTDLQNNPRLQLASSGALKKEAIVGNQLSRYLEQQVTPATTQTIRKHIVLV